MDDSTLIKTGTVGAIVAAVCCATPILVIGLGAAGLSAWAGYLDYALLPVLTICLGMAGYGLYKRRHQAAACCDTDSATKTTTARK